MDAIAYKPLEPSEEPAKHINMLFFWESPLSKYLDFDKKMRVQSLNGQNFVIGEGTTYSMYCRLKANPTTEMQLLPGTFYPKEDRLSVCFLSTLTTAN